jgi:hypothetical protein
MAPDPYNKRMREMARSRNEVAQAWRQNEAHKAPHLNQGGKHHGIFLEQRKRAEEGDAAARFWLKDRDLCKQRWRRWGLGQYPLSRWIEKASREAEGLNVDNVADEEAGDEAGDAVRPARRNINVAPRESTLGSGNMSRGGQKRARSDESDEEFAPTDAGLRRATLRDSGESEEEQGVVLDPGTQRDVSSAAAYRRDMVKMAKSGNEVAQAFLQEQHYKREYMHYNGKQHHLYQ